MMTKTKKSRKNFSRFKFNYIGKKKRIKNIFLRVRRFSFKTRKSRIIYSKRFLFAGIFNRRKILKFKRCKWIRPVLKYGRSPFHPKFFYFLRPEVWFYGIDDDRFLHAQEFLPFYYLMFEVYNNYNFKSTKYSSLNKRLGLKNIKKEPIFTWDSALSKMLQIPYKGNLYGKQPMVLKPFFYGPVDSYYLGPMRSPENKVLKFNIRMREEQRKYAKFMLLSRRQLCKLVREAYHYYGRSLYNFAIVLEYRLDNVLCRLNYTNNNLMARAWIKNGGVQLESISKFSKGVTRIVQTTEYVGQFDLIRVYPKTILGLTGFVNIFNFKVNSLYLLILLGLANDLFSAKLLVELGSVFVNGSQPVVADMSFPISNRFTVKKYSTYYFEKWLLDNYSKRLQLLWNLFLLRSNRSRFKNDYFALNDNFYAIKTLLPSINLFLILAGNITFYRLKRYMASNKKLKFLYQARIPGVWRDKLRNKKRLNLRVAPTSFTDKILQNPIALQFSKFKIGFRPNTLVAGENQGFVLGLSYVKRARLMKKHLQISKLLSAGRLVKQFWQLPAYLEINYAIESSMFYRIPYVSELRTPNIFVLYFIYYYFRKYT